MNGQILIVGNGDIPGWITAATWGKVIAADRAALRLLERGLVPDIAIGDFDSVTDGELSRITGAVADVRTFPAGKDETDLELAVEAALRLSPAAMTLTGATGGRLDHMLANLGLLERLHDAGMDACMVDRQNELRIVSGTYRIDRDARYGYFSIIPLTDSATVSLSGCVYPVTSAVFIRRGTLGVSNEVSGLQATVTVHTGKIILVRSSDAVKSSE